MWWEEGFSFTGFITASGATAIILGLALQAVIQDLFSGIAINLDGSYSLGDWLTIYSEQMDGPVYGRVTHMTWRSTFLTLDDGRRLMVPNHIVTANPVMNHSRPADAKRLSVEVSIDSRMPADRVVDMLLGEAFKAVRRPGLARTPEPSVLLSRLTQEAMYYEVRFYAFPDQIEPSQAKSIVIERSAGRHPAEPHAARRSRRSNSPSRPISNCCWAKKKFAARFATPTCSPMS